MHEETLKETPLAERHETLGARMVPFAGWRLPVQYAGPKQEHLAVRQEVGLFDVSHMGVVELAGPEATAVLEHLVTWPIARLRQGRAKYTLLLNEQGGVRDDLIVYRLAEDRWRIVWNAANHAANLAWVRRWLSGRAAELHDLTEATALLALQGPRWHETYAAVLPELKAPSRRFAFVPAEAVLGTPAMVARTGYTGEDGVEILLPARAAPDLWDHLLAAGATPCGLAARDSLRIEAGLPLYGHELTADRDPFTGGVGFAVRLDAHEFVGKHALVARLPSEAGIVGLRLLDRGVPREGYPVLDASGARVGVVTSGSYSPVLAAGIGLALVDKRAQLLHTEGYVEIRGRRVAASFEEPPLHRRTQGSESTRPSRR